MKRHPLFTRFTAVFFCAAIAPSTNAAGVTVTDQPVGAGAVTIASSARPTPIIVDKADHDVVTLAANLFADDVQRVTGQRPQVSNDFTSSPQWIVVGTLGKSPLIQKLIDAGKIKNLDTLKSKWD